MPEALRLLLWHWGRRGGGPRYTMELARALSVRSDIDLHLSLSRQSELFAATDAIGAPGFHVDTYQDLGGFLGGLPRLPSLRRELIGYLRRNRIDVVYNTMDFLWGSALAPAIPANGARYLLAVHDAERHPGEDGFFRRWLLARDIASADGAITMTESVRERLLAVHRFPAGRAWTAPLGVFIEGASGAMRQLPSGRPLRLLFFGRILPYKGLDVMLDALALIRAQRLDIELEIWCSGDLKPYAAALARAEGVRLEHGWMHEDDIPGVFARADICVLPYREASQSAVVASALASGMPIVTTPIPSLIEQVGGAGRVAENLTAHGFARAVLDLAGDPAAYARLSQAAIEISRTTLAWDSIAGRVVDAATAIARLPPRRRA